MRLVVVLAVLLATGCTFDPRGVDLPPAAADPSGASPAGAGPLTGTAPTTPSAEPPEVSPPDGADLGAAPDQSPAERPYGTACAGPAACGDLECLTGVGKGGDRIAFPGGYCTNSCKDESCGQEAVCVNLGGGTKLCAARCGSGTCREGYVCCPGSPSVCLPAALCDEDN